MASLLDVLGKSKTGPAIPAEPVAEPSAMPLPQRQSPLLDAIARAKPKSVEELPPSPPLPPVKPEFAPTPLQQQLGITEEQNKQSSALNLRLQSMQQQLVEKARQELGGQVEMPAIARGLASGTEGLKSVFQGLKAIGYKTLGDEQGMMDAAELAMKSEAKQQLLAPKYTKVEDLVSKGNLSDFFEFAAHQLGEQLPNIATTAATGGIGGLVGKKVGQMVAAKTIDEVAGRALIRKFVERGVGAGAFLGTTGIETGSTAEEQLTNLGTVQPIVAIGAGAIKGLLEVQTPLAIAGRFGIGSSLASRFYSGLLDKMTKGGFVKRIAGGGLVSFGGEFVTEGLQETVDNFARGFVDANYDALGPEAASRILNAAFAGGIVGAGYGGAASGLAGRPRPVGRPATAEETAQILGPSVGFTNPGGFFRGSEDPLAVHGKGEMVSFEDAATSDLERARPGDRIWQVDLAQIPEADRTATLESLPDERTSGKSINFGEANTDTEKIEVRRKLDEIITRRNRAEELLREQVPGTAFSVRKQEEARSELTIARNDYLALVTKGVRVQPISPTQGFMYVGEGPISPTAIREVPSTGFSVDPKDVVTVSSVLGAAPFGKTDEQTPLREYSGQLGEASGSAWISKSALEPWQISAVQPDLHKPGFNPTENLVFRPDVTPEKRAQLTEEFTNLYKAGLIPVNSYYKLRSEGLRITPPEGSKRVLLVDVNPRSLRQMPGHIGRAGALKMEEFNSSKKLFYEKFQGLEGYDQAKHAPGSVAVFGLKSLEGEERLNAQRAINALEALMPLLGKDFRMILDFSNVEDHYAEAYMRPGIGGYGSIVLTERALSNKTSAATGLFHEFGHHLSYSLFNNADPKTRSSIFSSWLRHLYAQERQSASEFLYSMHPPGHLAREKEVGNILFNSKQATVEQFFEENPWYQRWYDFDEWMAEQGAKYFTTKGTLGYDRYTAGFFKNLFDKILATLAKIGKTFGVNFEPEVAYRGWIDDLIHRQEEGGIPLTMASTISNQIDSDVVPSYGASLEAVGVPKALQQQTDKWAWYIRHGWNLLQIAQANRHIQGLQQYVERVRQWHIEKMSWISRADGRIREWRNLGKEMGQRLSDFIWDIESMSYLAPGQNARQPTLQELQSFAVQHQLSREALELYLKVKDDFLTVLDKIETIWRQDAVRSIQDPIQLTKAMNAIALDMKSLRSRPYFPHSRFGDWTVIVKDANGKLVEFRQFENQIAQDHAATELKKSALSGWTVQKSKLPDEVRMFRGIPPQLLRQIASKLQLTTAQRDWLDILIFDMSPANSFSKRLKKRKGVAGWNLDAMRGYANYFLHAANHLARIEHGWALEEAIRDVQKSATSMEDSRKRVAIRDYLDRHYQYIMNPTDEFHALRSLAFSWYLGFAPDSALINLTQIPLVAAPYLSARFGGVRALSELMKASKDLTSFYTKLNVKALSQDELDAIDLAIKHGFIDESQATELAAVSEGSNMARFIPGQGWERGAATLGRWASFMFQSVEKINRRVVFRAGYRLGRDMATSQDPKTRYYINELTSANQELYQGLLAGGMLPQNAVGFLVGRDAVERTQYEYAQWARPEFMRGKKGALFTFFMFTQNMLWFARYSPGNLRYLALLLATAGLMGLPGADDLAAILKFTISKLGGKFFDPELEARKLVSELTDRPDLIMHGLGRESFGMTMVGEMLGIPIPGFDLSSRIGMGRILPGVQPAFALGEDWNDRLAKTAEDVVGPAWSIPSSVAEGLAGFDRNNFKSFERLLPRAFKNVMRGLRYAVEGKETDAGGAELYRFDPMDPLSRLELGGVAMGFVPTGLRGKWDRQAAITEAIRFWQARRAVLYDQYYMAKRGKDRETVSEIRQAIRRFNHDVPSAKMRITLDSLQKSWKAREESRRERQQGKAQQKMLEPVAREIRGAFPEVPRGPGGVTP
jgi:hypothetical protein